MPTTHCIYSGDPLDPEPRPPEHIIPLSMGGSNDFVTNDVCSKANHRAGSEIDGALADDVFVKIYRQKFALVGYSHDVPNVEFPLVPKEANVKNAGRFVIPPVGAAFPVLPPSVQGSIAESLATGRPIRIEAQTENAREIAENLFRRVKAKGLALRAIDGRQLNSPEELLATGIRSTEDTVHAGYQIASTLHKLERFALKASIAYAHKVLGDAFSQSDDAKHLRNQLWHRTARWSATGLEGRVGAIPGSLAARIDLPDNFHTLQLTFIDDGVIAFGALFGNGPLQWALKLSANPEFGAHINKRAPVAFLDVTTRKVIYM